MMAIVPVVATVTVTRNHADRQSLTSVVSSLYETIS